MYKKICPSCNKDSYSSITLGEWLCPYCNFDLTLEALLPIVDVGNNDEEKPGEKVINTSQDRDSRLRWVGGGSF